MRQSHFKFERYSLFRDSPDARGSFVWLKLVCRDVLGCDQPKRPNMASMICSGARRILVDRRGGSIVGVVSYVGGIDDVKGDGVAPSGAVMNSSSGALWSQGDRRGRTGSTSCRFSSRLLRVGYHK